MAYFNSEEKFNEYLHEFGFNQIKYSVNKLLEKFPYCDNNTIKEDLFQEGCLALVRLNKKYKDDSEFDINQFNFYSFMYVGRIIERYIFKNNDYNFPVENCQFYYNIKNEIKENGYNETLEKYDNQKIIKRINLSEKTSYTLYNPNEIDYYFVDLIKNIEDELFIDNFIKYLTNISDRKARIFKLRLEGKTLDEISKVIGVNRNRISVLLAKVRDIFKNYLILNQFKFSISDNKIIIY